MIYPHLPDVPSDDLLCEIGRIVHDDYSGADAPRRSRFSHVIANGDHTNSSTAMTAIRQLLEERRVSAPWYSPLVPEESIARVSENRSLVALLARIVHPNAGNADLASLLAPFAKDDASAASDRFKLYLRILTFPHGESLRRALELLLEKRPIDQSYVVLLEKLAPHYTGARQPVRLFYVGCTLADSPTARKNQVGDCIRVSVLANIAVASNPDVTYDTYTLLECPLPRPMPNFDGSAATTRQRHGRLGAVAHTETVIRLLLGPIALNCAVGGWEHLIDLSPSTQAIVDRAREDIAQNKQVHRHGRHCPNPVLDRELAERIADAYRHHMPSALSRHLTSEQLEVCVQQSQNFDTCRGQVVTCTLGKDITKEALQGHVPFFAEYDQGKASRLIQCIERCIDGQAWLCIERYRGPFRDFWEILAGHSSPEMRLWAERWLDRWLSILSPFSAFVMGGEVANVFLNEKLVSIHGEAFHTSGDPFYRHVGRPVLAKTGPHPDNVMLIVCSLHPGKPAYNSVTSPYEIELIVLAKVVHCLTVCVTEDLLCNDFDSQPLAQGRLAFLRDSVLPRVLRMCKDHGIYRQLDVVTAQLSSLYGSFGAFHLGNPEFGEASRHFKENGTRRTLLAMGEPKGPIRSAQLDSLMGIVEDYKSRGMAKVLCRKLPTLTFADIGSVPWQTCLLTAGEGIDLWESMKLWGVNRLVNASPDEVQAHLAMRGFLTTTTGKKNRTTTMTRYYDSEVRYIALSGYPRHKASQCRFLFTCRECNEVFICNFRGQGGDRKDHQHNGHAQGHLQGDHRKHEHEHDQGNDNQSFLFKSRRIYTLGDIADELTVLVGQGRLSKGLIDFVPVRQVAGVEQLLKDAPHLECGSESNLFRVDDTCRLPLLSETRRKLQIDGGQECKMLAVYQILLMQRPAKGSDAHTESDSNSNFNSDPHFEWREVEEMGLTPIALAVSKNVAVHWMGCGLKKDSERCAWTGIRSTLGHLQHQHEHVTASSTSPGSSPSSRRNCRSLESRSAHMIRFADLPWNYRLALFRDAALVKSKRVRSPDWQVVLQWDVTRPTASAQSNLPATPPITPTPNPTTVANLVPPMVRPTKRNYGQFYRLLQEEEAIKGTISPTDARAQLFDQGLEDLFDLLWFETLIEPKQVKQILETWNKKRRVQ